MRSTSGTTGFSRVRRHYSVLIRTASGPALFSSFLFFLWLVRVQFIRSRAISVPSASINNYIVISFEKLHICCVLFKRFPQEFSMKTYKLTVHQKVFSSEWTTSLLQCTIMHTINPETYIRFHCIYRFRTYRQFERLSECSRWRHRRGLSCGFRAE